MRTAITSRLNHFILLLNRVAGAVFALIALTCVASVIVSLSYVDWSLAGFRALIATIFLAVAWLYLKGPFSRVGIGLSRQFTGLALAAPVLFVAAFVTWQVWREHQLRSYCEAIHVGMPVTEMLRLQKRHDIDESFLNPYNRRELHQEVADQDVEFIGGYPGDPDFVCSFRHNGAVVTSAEIVP
jgi:hypothetical protein